MKKKLLTTALLATFLWSCDSKDEPQKAQQETQATQQVVKTTLTLSEAKTQAEKRYQLKKDSWNQVFKSVAAHAGFKLEWQDLKYESNEQGASIQGVLSFELDKTLLPPDFPESLLKLNIPFTSTLLVSEELLKQNIEAQLKTQFYFDESLIKEMGELEVSKEEYAEIKKFTQLFSQSLNSEIQFLPQGKVASHFQLKPFAWEYEGYSLEFQGWDLKEHYHENDLAKVIYASKVDFDFKGMTFEEKDVSKLTVNAFKLNSELDEKGSGFFKSTPITAHASDSTKTIVFKVDSFHGDMKNSAWSSELGAAMGQYNMHFQNIGFHHHNKPQENIRFGNAHLYMDLNQKNNLIHADYQLKLDLENDVFALMSLPVEFSQANFQVGMKNIDVETYQYLSKLGQSNGENVEALIHKVMEGMVQSQAQFVLSGDLAGEMGNAFAKVEVSAPQGQFDALLAQGKDDPEALAELLRKFPLKAQVEVSEKLLKSVGLLAIVEMQTMPFVKKENGMLKYHLEMQDGVININGQDMSHLF